MVPLTGVEGGRQDGESGPGAGRVVGRARELSRVGELVARVAAGAGGVLLVAGEQGIGKSALLRAGLTGDAAAGCQVLWGTADELDEPFPLRLMARCLAGGGPAAGSAVGLLADGPLPDGLVSGDLVGAGVERVLALVDQLCAASPVILVAEDLQWADEASLAAWRRLSQAVGQLPLLLVGSFRPASARDAAAALRQQVASGPGTVLELGPLSAGNVAELAGELLGARPGPRLAELAGRAGGNPLYVQELVDALVRDGRVAVGSGEAELAGEPGQVPETLAAAIGDRLAALPSELLTVLRWGAVLGSEFSVADLARAAGLPAGEAARLAAEAATAGVLAGAGAPAGTAGGSAPEGDGTLGFRHGLIRQVVYEGVPMAVRAALHSQAARALAGAGEAPERVAAQLLTAQGTAGEWALDWLAEAIPVLAYRAPGVAARLLRWAIAELPSADRRREVLEAGLVAAAFLLVDRAEVERVARPLLARSIDPDRAAQVSWVLSHTLVRTGRAAEGMEVADRALALPGTSDVWAARLLTQQAVAHFALGRPEQAKRVAGRALAASARTGDGFAGGWAEYSLSRVATAQRDQAAALAHLDRGLELLGDDPRAIDLRLVMLHNRESLLEDADRLDEAGATIRAAMALVERSGTRGLAGVICTAAAEYYFEVGQWDDALTVLEDALTVLETVSGMERVDQMLVMVHGKVALVAAHRDDWAAADRHLAVVRDQDVTGSPVLRGASYHLLLARALAAERSGDLAGAVTVLAPCLDAEVAAGMGERYVVLPTLARLAAAAGDPGTAGAAAEAAAREAVAQPLPLITAAAQMCRGVATGEVGLLLSAAAYSGSAGRPLDRAQALEEAAVLLAARGEAEEARRAYTDAAAGYQALGAAYDLRRADARLRGFGIRRGRAGRRSPPSSGWESLTETEQVIARLAAAGRSNPDIAAELVLSRSTVQTHVSHILAKLGAGSRAGITRHLPRA